VKKSRPHTYSSYFHYLLETLSSFTAFISMKFGVVSNYVSFVVASDYLLCNFSGEYFILYFSIVFKLYCCDFEFVVDSAFSCHFLFVVEFSFWELSITFVLIYHFLSSLFNFYFIVCVFMWIPMWYWARPCGYNRTRGLWFFSILTFFIIVYVSILSLIHFLLVPWLDFIHL